MKRKLSQLLLALFVVSVVLGIAVYWLVARSLPQLDGTITVEGLSAKATIGRDTNGLVTIAAADRIDLAFATGFAHGQDRFFQMDLTRRKAAGELAELFGTVAVATDKRNRLHRFRARADEVLQASTSRDRSLLDAYANGVNAGLRSLDSPPFEYRFVGADPQPWRQQDSILVAYAMFMVLNDERAAADVGRGLAHKVLPDQAYDWMYPEGTEWDAPMLGEPRTPAPMPPAEVFDISALAVVASESAGQRYPEPELAGSNNWAVAGTHTDTGRAIVANDMHLDITVPNVFYRARLVVTGERDVTGVTLPGTPVVVAGSNGKVAWGFTNSFGDWSDAVIIQPGPDESFYRTSNGLKQYEVFQESINVKDAAAEVLEVRETIWGPVLDDDSFPDDDIAVSWLAHAPEAINLQQVELERVETVAEALAIANTMGIPPQNFVCGDSAGNIGWTIAGKIPQRGEYNAKLPADWSRKDGWLGWLPAALYPRIVNPESGRIWSANARVVDGPALKLIGFGGYDLGARARQIRDGLFASDKFVPADMLALQTDDRAVFLQRWRDLLLQLLDDNATAEFPLRQEYRRQLVSWIPRASSESVGYRLVRDYRIELRGTVFEMLMQPVRQVYGPDISLRLSNQFEAPLWQLVNERPPHLLGAAYPSWRQLLLTQIDRQISSYAQNYPDKLENRNWGERNTAAVQHPLSRAVPLLSSFLDMPAEPLSGDTNMPKALGPSFGASERFAVSPGDERNGYLHMPAGQSGHPMSDFYRAGHDDWAKVRATPFLPGESAYTLSLLPQN